MKNIIRLPSGTFRSLDSSEESWEENPTAHRIKTSRRQRFRKYDARSEHHRGRNFQVEHQEAVPRAPGHNPGKRR